MFNGKQYGNVFIIGHEVLHTYISGIRVLGIVEQLHKQFKFLDSAWNYWIWYRKDYSFMFNNQNTKHLLLRIAAILSKL